MKFNYASLTIINIVLEFEKVDNIYNNLGLIYELLQPT